MRLLALLLVGLSIAAAPANDYQISGIVVDHLTNRPLNHVLVEINLVSGSEGSASVVTNADGRFTFLHVPKGKYNLQAQKRGQFPQGFHATDGGYATAIVVDGSLRTDNLIFPLRTDSSISGTVTGDDGEPIANAQLHLFRESVNNGEAQTIQLNNSVTGSSGKFHFSHLEAGQYYLAASATAWYSQPGTETVYPVTFYGDTTDAGAARLITLTEGAAASVQIQMHAQRGIRVKLPHGLQNVLLSVPGPGGTHIPVPTAITGARGQTLFHASGDISGSLVAQPDAGEDRELSSLAAGRYFAVGFDMQQGPDGGTGQPVDLTDGSTLSLENKVIPAEVSGHVIFDTPRNQEQVNLFLSGNARGLVAEVGADGTFKFEKTAGGKFDVNLNSSSLIVTSMQAKGAQIVHDHLEIPSGAAVDLTIHVQSAQAMAKLDGFAVQGEAGVAGAMVLLVPQDLDRTRLIRRDQSDADGSFSLTGIQPGRYTLLAIDNGEGLAYKDPKMIKTYVINGLSLTIPLANHNPLKVPVQTRKP